MMADVDFFKIINASFGHKKGDEVLEEVAKTIQSVFQGKNDIVCRMGGEEFAVFFIADSRKIIKELASEAMSAVEGKRIELGRGSKAKYVTISLGYSYASCEKSEPVNLDRASFGSGYCHVSGQGEGTEQNGLF